ncbi:MAG: ribosomal protein S18-alanine N-acetyltransferase [Cellulomonadaceae bacterium]
MTPAAELDADLELTVDLAAQDARPGADGVDGVLLRPLAWADVTRVAALEAAIFGPSAWTMGMLTEELRGAGRWYVAAQPEGQGAPAPVIGYAGIWFDGEHAHVMTLGVEAEHRRRGLGRVLLAALVARARQLGAATMLLEVAVDNSEALRLYRRLGFEQIGLRKRYYQPENTDAYTMQLTLRETGDDAGE